MSRVFTNSTTVFAEYTPSLFSVTPLTLMCWYRWTGSPTAGTLVSYCRTSSTRAACLDWAGNSKASLFGDSGSTTSTNSGSNPADTWQHYAAVFASSTSRTAYLDGVAGTTNTTSNAIASAITPRVLIGAKRYSTGIQTPSAGMICEVAIWNSALSAAEVAQLSNRDCRPLDIKPTLLRNYWPLYGNISPETDFAGGYNPLGSKTFDHITLNGTPAKGASHAPVVSFVRKTYSYPLLVTVTAQNTHAFMSLAY